LPSSISKTDRVESDAVSEMLTDYYGGDVPRAALTPPRDPAKLRAGLAVDAPQFANVAEETRGLLDDEVSGVLIPKLGLTGQSLDAPRKSAFALAVLLGNVTETESDDHRFVGGCQGRARASPTVIEILTGFRGSSTPH
jgi:hypothetical protein